MSPPASISTSRAYFNCEGGVFEVAWSGAVNISETIHIGKGTTVKIVGHGNPSDTSETVSDTGSSDTTGARRNSSSKDQLDVLTARLSIPRGLTSAAVRVGSSAGSDKSSAFGSIYFVHGGQLFLENMAIRGGFDVSSNYSATISGGGIHAENSNLTVTRCEFKDDFAELGGGGIFGNWSTLVVVDSVFRNCRAGVRPAAGNVDVIGAGGAVGVNTVYIFQLASVYLNLSVSFGKIWLRHILVGLGSLDARC